MHTIRFGLALLLTLLCAAEGVERPRIGGFAAPSVTPLDWDTRSLGSADMNDDGLVDLIVINNDRATIDILLQRSEDGPVPSVARSVRRNRWEPVLDDAFFLKESVSTGLSVYVLTAADFNGDGRADLAFTSEETPLSIRYRDEEGGFEEAVIYDRFDPLPWTSSVWSGDYNQDGKEDLVLLGTEKILLFPQDNRGLSDNPETLRITAGNAYGIGMTDLNLDGLEDLFYSVGTGERAFRIRLQKKGGGFGPEHNFDLDIGPDIVHPLPVATGDGFPVFAYLHENSRAVETFTLEPMDGKEPVFSGLRPLAFPVSSGEQAASYAIGDFDGDGRSELAVADPRESSVRLYRRDANWTFIPSDPFPSLAGISSLTAFPHRDGDLLIVSSDEENFAGISRITGEGRLSFPVPLPVSGEAHAVTAGKIASDGEALLLVVTQQGRNHRLSVLEPHSGHPSGFQVRQELSIPDVKRDPERMRLFDLSGDGQKELILFAPREPARFFRILQGGDPSETGSDRSGEPADSSENAEPTEEKTQTGNRPVAGENEEIPLRLVEVAVDSSVRKSLMNGIGAENVGFGDVDGDEIDEMIVTGEGFARSVGLDAEDRFIIFDQFNARSPDDRLRSPLVFDTDDSGSLELLFYEEQEGSLQRLMRDENGVLRYKDAARMGRLEILGAITPHEGDSSPVILLGEDRFWVLRFGGASWKKEEIGSYETDLKDVEPTLLVPPKAPEGPPWPLIAIDGGNNILELLLWSPPNEWASPLHFTIFETNIHYRGRTGAPLEPREAILEDITGDGILDLALLVHDRVLVYPGTPIEAP